MKNKKVQNKYYEIGDTMILSDGHECEVLEIDEFNDAIKVKSLEPNSQLGKTGWFEEDGDWIIFVMDILENYN